MLYLGYAFMMPNEKLQLQKNQLIRSAAGWSKDHIMLSLTPADTYTKSVNWIKMNFPTVEIDCHPSRRTFLMDSSPALTQSLMDAVWTDGLIEIFCLSQDFKPCNCDSQLCGEIPRLQFPPWKRIIQNPWRQRHPYWDPERSSPLPDWEAPI